MDKKTKSEFKEELATFFKRLFCFHRKKKVWKIINIAWDGTAIVECKLCGTIKNRQMS